jgi:hypothetical protein
LTFFLYGDAAYFAATFLTVFTLRIVAGIPIVFSSNAPEKADSPMFLRHNQ